jgi:hypothetical protein
MPTVNRITRRDLLGLALVLLIASMLRLGEPGMVEFLHDEAYLSLLAQDLVAGGEIPLTGIPSSVGIPNPPISLYIMAIPYALSSSPVFASLFIAALNVVGVGLLWLIAHRYLNRKVALLTGLAYALNPWAVLYSRKIWAQDFHTPLFLFGLLLGLLGFIEGKRWAQVLCLPVLFLAFQIHFAAWTLLPLYLWLLWSGRKQISWQAMVVSIILAATTLGPFLIGLTRTLEDGPYRLSNALDQSDGGLSVSADALTFAARLATGLGLETWVAPEQQGDLLHKAPPPSALWLVLGIVTLLGFAIVWKKYLHNFWPGLLMLWAIVPILIFTPTWTKVYPHYFVASIPAYALLAAIGAVWLAEYLPGKPYTPTLVTAIFGVILLTQGFWWRGLLRYLDTTATPSGYGTPVHYLLDVRDAFTQYNDVLVISDGFEALYDQEPAAWPVLLRDTADCVRTITGDGVAVFPDHPFAVLVAPNAPENPVDNLYFTNAPQTFGLRSDAGIYAIHTFDRAPEWEKVLRQIPPARFDSGIQLTGYRLEQNRLYLEWLLPGQVSEDYHYFGHFLDASGEKLGQRDNILWPGRFWCAGDRLITWADIDLPDGVEILRVGLYAFEHGGFVNSSVLDAVGNGLIFR